jgi:hypothetical protein
VSDSNSLPPVARKVYYPCKKCEVERYQVVMAHSNSKTAKLECEVCHTKNTFKITAPQSATLKSGKPRKVAKNARGSHKVRWEQLTSGDKEATPYNMKKAFEVETLISHPKFGLGVVTALTSSSIQVVFEDQERSLVHNRQ